MEILTLIKAFRSLSTNTCANAEIAIITPSLLLCRTMVGAGVFLLNTSSIKCNNILVWMRERSSDVLTRLARTSKAVITAECENVFEDDTLVSVGRSADNISSMSSVISDIS